MEGATNIQQSLIKFILSLPEINPKNLTLFCNLLSLTKFSNSRLKGPSPAMNTLMSLSFNNFIASNKYLTPFLSANLPKNKIFLLNLNLSLNSLTLTPIEITETLLELLASINLITLS